MVAASLHFGTVKNQIAHATAGDNVMGWLWADPIGWTSVNSANPGACASAPCGSYGLNLNISTREINGFAWNDSAGWICFGTSCAAVPASCGSVPPAGLMKAWIDPVGSPAPATVEVHGWANICNLGTSGWISLNCQESPGSGGVGCPALAYKYRAVFVSDPTSSFQGNFGNPLPPPDLASYGWNGNDDGTGYGYVDFRMMRLNSPENTAPLCADGIDNNLNGKVDCADPVCAASPVFCPSTENTPAKCTNLIDDDLNAAIDCADGACLATGVCHVGIDESSSGGLTSYIIPAGTTAGSSGLILGASPVAVDYCMDGIDNNGFGGVDCSDASCLANPICAVLAPGGDVGTLNPAADAALIHYLCSDGRDNGKQDGLIDCADASCLAMDPACTPAWIQAKFGNVYAQQGITAPTSSAATYCLTSGGAITGFGGATCKESSPSQSLPTTGTGYKGTLGSLDIAGILAGRYGTVVPIATDIGIPAILSGKVYYRDGDLTLNAKTFQNGSGTTRGNGLLVVNGTLTVNGNIGYLAETLPTSIRDLSSFGVIVKKNALGLGGNIVISPGVTTVSGAYFAEGMISTGTFDPAADSALRILGLMAAHQFNLQRKYRNILTPAESFTFDGRAVANPPPGMQEVGKSLPASKDAF